MDHGCFISDGSWVRDLCPGGKVHDLVVRLVHDRRSGNLSPERAAQEIESQNCPQAFPNREQWSGCSRWPLVQCSTSAEEVIKRAGIGAAGDRHWCSGNWVSGKEKDCASDLHRIKPTEEETARLVRTLSAGFE